MRKTFILFMLSICAAASMAMADFTRVVQVVVTEPNKETVEATLIEVGGKKFYTNFDGVAYLDLPPGKYVAKLSKISYEDQEYEIEIREKTAIIFLCIEQ